MNYRTWYERFPRMFAEERNRMQHLGFSLDEGELGSQKRVQFRGKSRVDPNRELTIRYPDSFPSKAPRVFASGGVFLRRHQRVDNGEICTFGPGQSRWSATLTGTDAIQEAEIVLSAMLPHPAGAEDTLVDDVPEPASAQYLYQTPTYILVPPAIAMAVSTLVIGASGLFRIKLKNWESPVSRTAPGRAVITELRVGNNSVRSGPYYDNLVQGGLDINRAVVTRLDEAPPVVKSGTEFASWLRNIGVERHDWMGFVFPEQSGAADKQRVGWLIFRSRQERYVEPIRTFVMDGGGRNIRMPGLQALPSKTVVLIGCGSLGSKIAVSLAAAGVENFRLVDFDFIEPDNAVRHECGVDFFGVPKCRALEQRLLNLNPQVFGKTKMLDMVVGAINPYTTENQLQELISTASLVIETTGDNGVSRYINDISALFKVPQIYASVTNGAWAGEVVRAVPGVSACWMCWLYQYHGTQPPGEPISGPGVFAPGCDQPTFTGASYDIGVVASLASSFAVDTLLLDEPDRNHFAGDYLRWQLRSNDGSIEPSISSLQVQKRNDCAFCGSQ